MAMKLEPPDWHGGQLQEWREKTADIPAILDGSFEPTWVDELNSGSLQYGVNVEETLTPELYDYIHDEKYADWLDIKDCEKGARVRTRWSCYTNTDPSYNCIKWITEKSFKAYEERTDVAHVTDDNRWYRIPQLAMMNATATIVKTVLPFFTKRLYGHIRDSIKYTYTKLAVEHILRRKSTWENKDYTRDKNHPDITYYSKARMYLVKVPQTIWFHAWIQSWEFATRGWFDRGVWQDEHRKSRWWEGVANWLNNWYYTGWTWWDEKSYHAKCVVEAQECDEQCGSDTPELHAHYVKTHESYPCYCDSCNYERDPDLVLDDFAGTSDFQNWDWGLLGVEEV